MLLREIAHSRTGDKGNIVTISLIAYNRRDFDVLERLVTAEKVQAYFADFTAGAVSRYAIPHLGALNFVIRRPADQAVTRSLALDAHGKCLGSALLGMEIEEDAFAGRRDRLSRAESDR